MTRTLLSATLFFLFSTTLIAQNVGIGTSAPHASAQLDVSSSTKGLLAPRMTTAQRNAIGSPAIGLLAYDTDVKSLFQYNGSVWVNMSGAGLALPYAGVASIDGVAFRIDNVGTAIQGNATKASAAAITGSSTGTGGIGVMGQSHDAAGFGLAGYSSAGNAVYGFSAASGTALRGVSVGGYGLLVSGNLRLTGGNTNPSAGAVLTSVDASGNAVWKPAYKIAFSATNPANAYIPSGVARKVEFGTE